MKMDRVMQSEILSFILEKYPERLSPLEFQKLRDMTQSDKDLAAQLMYFEEHGLIAPGSVGIGLNNDIIFNSAALRLTAKGIDFLADDGGLGAILNVLTVQIHDDSLAKIEAFLLSSSLPQPEKQKFLSRLKSLPADATKHAVLKLVDLGLGNVPAALELLQKALS